MFDFSDLSNLTSLDPSQWRWGMLIPIISLALCLIFACFIVICCCKCGSGEAKNLGVYCKNCDSTIVESGVFTVSKNKNEHPEMFFTPNNQTAAPMSNYEQRSSFYYDHWNAREDPSLHEDGSLAEEVRIRTEIIV